METLECPHVFRRLKEEMFSPLHFGTVMCCDAFRLLAAPTQGTLKQARGLWLYLSFVAQAI